MNMDQQNTRDRTEDAPASLMDELRLALTEHRARARELHRWKVAALFAATGVLAMFGVFHAARLVGPIELSRPAPALAMVDVVGDIERTGPASASALVPAIRHACMDSRFHGLVLNIDSGGGAVAEADRIARALELCKGPKGKPVIATISGTGASAAYLISINADRIIANRFAMVGSVGAYIREPAPAQGPSRTPISSGALKLMLADDPTPEQRAARRALVDAAAGEIEATLRARRPWITDWDVVMSGQTFDARRAKDLGLIDDINTIDFVIDREFPGLIVQRVAGP